MVDFDNTLDPTEGYIQTIPTAVLAAAARGEIDLNHLAKLELACRGLDLNGKWIGFEQAGKLYQAQ